MHLSTNTLNLNLFTDIFVCLHCSFSFCLSLSLTPFSVLSYNIIALSGYIDHFFYSIVIVQRKLVQIRKNRYL